MQKKFLTDFDLESVKKKQLCTGKEIGMCQMSFMSKVMERTLRQIVFSVLEFSNSFSSLARFQISEPATESETPLNFTTFSIRKMEALCTACENSTLSDSISI